MCGIAGIYNPLDNPVPQVLLGRMAAVMAHRGPDGEGFFVDRGLGLAHRRLAIIDLSSAADQPMLSADGRHALVFNGEIYNFRVLRGQLEALGHQFRSHSDTEVILHGFRQWGPGIVTRLNGMFAFAIWDGLEQSLFIARDRYGIKPLYYSWAGGDFVFASECKAILEHPDRRFAIDPEALLEYFTFQNLFTDRTLFAGIRLLPAGCHLTVRHGGTSEDIVKYWDFDFREPERPAAAEEYLEELDRLFRQAVNRQLIADVELGSYLSGGMDSGSITAVAAGQLPYLKTFTCGFDLSSASGMELAFDERSKAEAMSYRFRTEHYEMVLKAGDMERVMPRLAWHLEEPRVGQSYPNFYAAQLASKFVKVVLSGAGGDELFGGYPWRYYRAVVNNDFDDYIDKYYAYWQRMVPNTALRRLFEPIWPSVSGVWTRDIFKSVFQRHADVMTRPEDYINHSLYFEAKTFLHGLLVVEDKLSMAHSLETRVPFLDNDLVDFAMRVPVGLKIGQLGEVVRVNENEPAKVARYYERTRDGKLLLRQMMSRYIPAAITDGEKQGFSAPDASWFKGESIDYVRQEILGPRARIYDYLDRDTVAELVGEHLDGRVNRRLLIWSLLNVEHMLRRFG